MYRSARRRCFAPRWADAPPAEEISAARAAGVGSNVSISTSSNKSIIIVFT